MLAGDGDATVILPPMIAIARSILVACTVLATFVAASLQGRVLCSSSDGGHLAIEDPHHDGGCPSGHDDHHHDHGAPHQGEADPKPAPAGCTDVAAEFVVAREGAPAAVADAPLPGMFALSPITLTAHNSRASCAVTASGHPPAAGDLAAIRTIVLLV